MLTPENAFVKCTRLALQGREEDLEGVCDVSRKNHKAREIGTLGGYFFGRPKDTKDTKDTKHITPD